MRDTPCMNAYELTHIGHKLYGSNRGWRQKLAAAIGVDTSTMRRWISADSIPEPAAIALRSLGKRTKPHVPPGICIIEARTSV